MDHSYTRPQKNTSTSAPGRVSTNISNLEPKPRIKYFPHFYMITKLESATEVIFYQRRDDGKYPKYESECSPKFIFIP
jgi:hypothetical protein